MKNKPNLDLYPFNKKKVSLDLLYEKATFSRPRGEKVSQQELESLNLSTLEKSFFLKKELRRTRDEFISSFLFEISSLGDQGNCRGLMPSIGSDSCRLIFK